MLLAAGGAAAYLLRDQGPSYPSKWDDRVTDIVSFDETTRGLQFKHPVEIRFLTEDEFTKKVTTSSDNLSEEDRQQLDNYQAAFRSLGLIGGDVDLLKETNDLHGNGTLAYYDPHDKIVRVKGTDLTTDVKVTLAHELTHALQDQYFDLNRLDNLQTDGEKTAMRAVVEGDAVNVQNAYVAQLSSADRQDYLSAEKSGADQAYSNVPEVLVANFTAPYIIGPQFVAALQAKGGNAAVNEAIKSPPVSEAALLNFFTYLDTKLPAKVDEPSLPDGATRLDGGDFGASTWYLMLARRLDVHSAITAVDNWGGDSFAIYKESSGRTCVALRYKGQTADETAAVQSMLGQWVAQSPPDTASVTTVGDTAELRSCDPGTDVAAAGTDQSMGALTLLAVRLEVVAEGYKEGAPSKVLECASNGLADRLDVADLAPDADPQATQAKVQTALVAAIAAC